VELGEDHCATCFADGVQMVTGCTFGKGNIKKLHYGKWGLTLVEVATGRAVRVTARAEAMLANKQTSFFKDTGKSGYPPPRSRWRSCSPWWTGSWTPQRNNC
jgi:formylmethanofuran dehydrogenase subunit E